ncbi:MAG: hypothetical protein HY350_02640 [Candidatus Omnitrophica bacterium]|nr:hypothetical protein [Candidatus Omnitrophota bacterium]
MAGRKSDFLQKSPTIVLKSLTGENIPFVVVGGAAIALHGIPRSTLDIDVVVPAHNDIVAKLFSATKSAGFFSKQEDVLNLKPGLLAGQWITFQDSTGRELIDILFEDSKTFDKLLRRAVKRQTEEFIFYVACLDDLEAMKKSTGRPIDRADVALIQEKRNYMKKRMRCG